MNGVEAMRSRYVRQIWTGDHEPGGGSRRRRNGLAGLLAFGALNAFAGGYYGLEGAPGVPIEWLHGSPFRDYFIPSLVLFFVVGGSMLAAAILVFMRSPLGRVAALAAGVVLLIWISVQVAVIGYVSWMQPATAAGAVLVLWLAALVSPPADGPGRVHQ